MKKKIAIVHDWLEKKAGAEKVLEEILKIFPNSDIFVIVDFMSKNDRKFLLKKKIIKSFIQYLPFSKNHFRKYIFLFPIAVKLFNLKKYDLIISSSHSFAKNISKNQNQTHFCYCHTPSRYAHFMTNRYLKNYNINNFILKLFLKLFLKFFAKFDIKNSENVDRFFANSNFVKLRIKRIYGKDSKVIYPPVKINNFKFKSKKKKYFLTASRLVPYKKIDIIISAFNLMPQYNLIVCGDGPELSNYKKLSKKNVFLKGWVTDKELINYMQNANAFIFAAEEDFGILPVEALASGTPVIALNKGGTSETILSSSKLNCGKLFNKQNKFEIIQHVKSFQNQRNLYKSINCRKRSLSFSDTKFRNKFSSEIKKFI